MTKETDEFLTPKTLRDKFGRRYPMKNCLGIDETPSAREQSFKTASKLKRKLQTNIEMESALLKEILFLVEFIHVKIQEASKNSDLDIH